MRFSGLENIISNIHLVIKANVLSQTLGKRQRDSETMFIKGLLYNPKICSKFCSKNMRLVFKIYSESLLWYSIYKNNYKINEEYIHWIISINV